MGHDKKSGTDFPRARRLGTWAGVQPRREDRRLGARLANERHHGLERGGRQQGLRSARTRRLCQQRRLCPDGKAIATASNDRTVKIWHAGNGQAIRTLNGHDDWVNSVAYSPDGKRIASASYDHTVRLWNTSTYEQVLILKGHSGYVYNALFSPDGRRIASGSVDGTLKLWEPDRTIAIN